MIFLGNNEVRTLVYSTLVQDYKLGHSRERIRIWQIRDNLEFIGNPASEAIIDTEKITVRRLAEF